MDMGLDMARDWTWVDSIIHIEYMATTSDNKYTGITHHPAF
jgi:hypothetical protein